MSGGEITPRFIEKVNPITVFVVVLSIAVFVIALIAYNNIVANTISAASDWSISSKAEWDEGDFTTTESNTGTLNLSRLVGWYDPSYSYRRKTTFNNADQAENLLNLPVMVKVTDDDLSWSNKIQADMDDVAFVDSNNSDSLSFEWEANDLSGTSIAHVKVPQIDQSSATDHIYIYYGNEDAVDQSAATDVWSNGYVGVWHLIESAAGTGTADVYQDSTLNSYDGDDGVSATGKVGMIGEGQEFDRTSINDAILL